MHQAVVMLAARGVERSKAVVANAREDRPLVGEVKRVVNRVITQHHGVEHRFYDITVLYDVLCMYVCMC